MNFLLETTENYRVASENDAKQQIEEAKSGRNYILKKYTSQYKERKQKGEVVDAWYKVTLVKEFTNEKEPDRQTTISYNDGTESAF